MKINEEGFAVVTNIKAYEGLIMWDREGLIMWDREGLMVSSDKEEIDSRFERLEKVRTLNGGLNCQIKKVKLIEID